MMTCPDCGENLDDVPVGEPCPQCGGSGRDARVLALPALARVEAARPTIGIGYNQPRPWKQKWNDVLYALGRVESVYSVREGQGNEDVRRAVEGFFNTCRELADWLWQDPNSGLDRKTVLDFVRDDPDLRLADGVAQTTKHHTRTGAEPITARVALIFVGPDGGRAQIDWWKPTGEWGSVDAYELAHNCVQAWRRFLGL
jgi:hypothetical protein